MIFVDGKVVGHEALAIAPADDRIAAGRDHALDAEAEGGMMDVESSDDVGWRARVATLGQDAAR
jgi:hypothetical protein